MSLILLLPAAVAAVATTLWAMFSVSMPIGVIIGVAWILAAYSSAKWFKSKVSVQAGVMAGMLVVTTVFNLVYTSVRSEKPKDNQNTAKEEIVQPAPNPEGTIIIEAGDGTLTTSQNDTQSYITESARGREAYLAAKLATASYSFEAPKTGVYTLWVKLSDDGTFDNEARSVNIVVNGAKQIAYHHVSEDTKGWKYYQLENFDLNAGTNKIEFTKIADTYAAYVMDEFRFVPVK